MYIKYEMNVHEIKEAIKRHAEKIIGHELSHDSIKLIKDKDDNPVALIEYERFIDEKNDKKRDE